MYIHVVVHHFPPRYTAGAEWQAFRTAQGLIERGHQVRVVAVEHVDQGPIDGVTWTDDEFQGVSVRRLSFNRAHVKDLRLFEYRNPWIGAHLRELWAVERPDLVHVVSGYLISGTAFEAAEALGLPTVLTLTDFWWLCPRVTLRRSDGTISTLPLEPWRCVQCLAEEQSVARNLGRWLPGPMRRFWRGQSTAPIEARQAYLRERFERVARVISPSRFLRDLHVQAGIREDQIIVSRQGIELIDRGLHLQATKTTSDKLRVAYLGQIAHLKGIHVLVEAARQIDDPRLEVRIYGDLSRFPRYVDELRAAIGDDRRIMLAGAYSDAQGLARILSDTDVIVVPSLWYENSPNVLLEAFAFRTPAIASDFGGMAELVAHGVNGLRFELGNAIDLGRQLRRLLDDPQLLRVLGAGVPAVRSVAEEIDELVRMYADVLHSA